MNRGINNKKVSFNRMVASRLKEARLASGLRIVNVSRISPDISPKRLAEWEDGKKAVPSYWLCELADIYGVSLDWVMAAEESPEPHRDYYSTLRIARTVTNQWIASMEREMKTFADNRQCLNDRMDRFYLAAIDALASFERVVELNQNLWESMKGGSRLEVAFERCRILANEVDIVRHRLQTLDFIEQQSVTHSNNSTLNKKMEFQESE